MNASEKKIAYQLMVMSKNNFGTNIIIKLEKA